MRGLLLFTVGTGDAPFDSRVLETLQAEQVSRKNIYHMERVRVEIGAEQNCLRVETDGLVWRVNTDEMGDVADTAATESNAQQLVTQLYAKVQESQDTACDVVFLAADSVCATAALRLASVIQARFVNLYSAKFHLILLQDQLTCFRDEKVWHMLQTIKAVNTAANRFYSSLYLLPWEGDKREATRATIVALVKVMVTGAENPMLVPQVGANPMWIGTAAVTHLEAPIHEIARVVFQYLTERFMSEVLEPALQQTDAMLEGSKGLETRTMVLRDLVSEMVHTQRMMPLSELFEIMPAQDPTVILAEREDAPRAEAAWREIFHVYGDDVGAVLKDKLKPGLEQLEAQYASLGEAVKMELLRQSLGLVSERGLGMQMLPNVMDTLGQKLMTSTERGGGEVDTPNYKRGVFLNRDTKAAVGIARTRQAYLTSVYIDARKTYTQRHREVRQRTVKKAISDARQYVHNTLLSLANSFRQSCDIHLEQMPSGSFYSVRLRDVYVDWCRSQVNQMDIISPQRLCEMFTDEVLSLPSEQASRAICDKLILCFTDETEKLIDRVRIHISQFFKEISFRSSLLPSIGVSDNLVSQLIDYMDQQTTVLPILFESAGGMAVRTPKARAFVFHEVGGDCSHEFGQLARDRNINVINDPHESGVEMLVKYAGNALDHMLLYLNNKPADGEI